MNYEEKYKQALERAKEELRVCGSQDCDAARQIFRFFPELKESEDEKMRKALYADIRTYIPNERGDKYIAWLEKQGEHKPTDKVESKFNVGDWVVLTAGELSTTLQIVNVDTNKKLYWFNDYSYLPIVDEEFLHLWTIADAKDGDVLVASDGSIFLFAGVVDCACKYYVALATDNHVKINKEAKGGYWETSKAVYPATKEQRVLLFEKMKEAGYEWDAEKKEVKKIESKTLDVDKVIMWIRKYWPFKCWGNVTLLADDAIEKFKKDFGLC